MGFTDLLVIYRLQIACVFFTMLVAIPYFAFKREKAFDTTLFKWLFTFHIFALAGDMLTVYTVNNMDTVPKLVNDAFHIFFVSSLFTFSYITFTYIRYQVTGDGSRRKILIYGIPVAFSLLALIIIPIEYIQTDMGNYSAGLGVNAVYGLVAVYLTAMLFMLIRYRKRIDIDKRRVLLIAVLTEFIVSGMQLFIPTLLISSIATTVITAAIFLTIENPDRVLRDMYKEAYDKINEQNKTITGSINYASKIQRNLLPVEAEMRDIFSDFSVIWKPRDIVGGDVYWMKKLEAGTVLCVADCTGHGTPGAFLTMLVTSALESIVQPANCDDTAGIIWQLDQRLSGVLHVEHGATDRHSITDICDGCDLAVLFIAKDGTVKFSSGNIPVFVCDGVDVKRYKGQRIYVGEGKLKSKDEVNVHSISANPNNKYYIASDGLFTQIGKKAPGSSETADSSEHGIQFGHEAFKEIIEMYHSEKLSMITEKVWEEYEYYRGFEAQRDDFELVAFVP